MMLQSLQDLPIRAGFLFDISASMREEIDFNRSVIQMYVSRLIRKGVDQAFVMQFDTHTLLVQDWTDKDSAFAIGSAAVGPRPDRFDPLTAIFDSLYTTCRDRWGAMQEESTGNSRPLRQSSGISTVLCTSRPALQPMDLFIASGCNPWFPEYAS